MWVYVRVVISNEGDTLKKLLSYDAVKNMSGEDVRYFGSMFAFSLQVGRSLYHCEELANLQCGGR